MKNTKKILSLVLVFVMIVTMLPTAPIYALAAEAELTAKSVCTGTDTAAAYAEATIIAQGNCGADGSNVQWKHDDSGTLTISGKGAMKNYSSSNLPWGDYKNAVTTVVVERGITHIGNYSFSYFKNLTTVTMADTVKTIGECVFFSCDKLTSVKLSNSITSIGNEAFQYCENLTSVKLPDSITSIGNFAFADCINLTEIKLPISLKSISGYTFIGCSNLTSVVIPNSVETIGTGAFELVPLTTKIPLVTVHYSGTSSEWKNIVVYDDNVIVCKYGTRHYCTETSWKAATCTEEGKEGGIYCSTCQKYVKEPNTIPINPDKHSFSNGICSRCKAYDEPELKDGYYRIKNAGQLYWFANYVNTVDRTANAVLLADIDLEGKSDGTGRKWTPIGSTGENSNNFRGIFDGQNHTITGLYVEGGRAGLGFFGEVRTGTVRNFTIYGDVVVNTEVDYVGGAFGSVCGLNAENDLERNGATIQNITSYVNLTAKKHGIGRIGGFIGYANHESIIENCAWYGTFDAGVYRVDSGAGGLIGRIYDTATVTIRNCGAYGTIKTAYKSGTGNSGESTVYIGGLLSYSPARAKTVLENNLWAGQIINNTDLASENAHLSAYGTLSSDVSITNCFALKGTPYVTTNNENMGGITTVTAEQLASGEFAYKLGESWGQTIGTDDYPVLGGATVYATVNCIGETVYANTDEEVSHHYENGSCTVCGAADPDFAVDERGDINGDGAVNSIDSNLFKRILAGVLTPDDDQKLGADIDGDGIINSIDSNYLARMIAGAE